MKEEENSAIATGRNLRISRKSSVEVARFIKGKKVEKVKEELEKVIKKEKFIPFKRFLSNVGHRKGGSIGKYPVNVAKEFKRLIRSAEENASYIGLRKELYVAEAIVNTGPRFRTPKRKIGRTPKLTHIKIKLKEVEK